MKQPKNIKIGVYWTIEFSDDPEGSVGIVYNGPETDNQDAVSSCSLFEMMGIAVCHLY